jgi:dCMP deaminase
MDINKASKYYQLAKYQADLFSKDPSTKVAAILLAHDTFQILSTGFNGICRKLKETEERWTRPLKYKWVAHAELNAIANAARSGVKVESSICVVTMFPCVDCCKALIQSGIDTIVTEKPDMDNLRWGEDFKISLEMMEEVGIKIIYVE